MASRSLAAGEFGVFILLSLSVCLLSLIHCMPSVLPPWRQSAPVVYVALPLYLLTLQGQLGFSEQSTFQLPCQECRDFGVCSTLGVRQGWGRLRSADFSCFSAYLCWITNLICVATPCWAVARTPGMSGKAFKLSSPPFYNSGGRSHRMWLSLLLPYLILPSPLGQKDVQVSCPSGGTSTMSYPKHSVCLSRKKAVFIAARSHSWYVNWCLRTLYYVSWQSLTFKILPWKFYFLFLILFKNWIPNVLSFSFIFAVRVLIIHTPLLPCQGRWMPWMMTGKVIYMEMQR